MREHVPEFPPYALESRMNSSQALFHELDTDGDGSLSSAELKRAIKENSKFAKICRAEGAYCQLSLTSSHLPSASSARLATPPIPCHAKPSHAHQSIPIDALHPRAR